MRWNHGDIQILDLCHATSWCALDCWICIFPTRAFSATAGCFLRWCWLLCWFLVQWWAVNPLPPNDGPNSECPHEKILVSYWIHSFWGLLLNWGYRMVLDIREFSSLLPMSDQPWGSYWTIASILHFWHLMATPEAEPNWSLSHEEDLRRDICSKWN